MYASVNICCLVSNIHTFAFLERANCEEIFDSDTGITSFFPWFRCLYFLLFWRLVAKDHRVWRGVFDPSIYSSCAIHNI